MSEETIILRVRLSLKGRPIHSYAFEQDVITVGRDPEADIVLDNPGVSREHLRIERLPNGQFCVKDLGSANGTFLNDQPVESAMIYHSDVIRIGKFALWLGIESDRRGSDAPAEPRRAPAELSPETMMLSTDELERLMTSTREPDGPAAPRRAPERPRAATPAPPVARRRPAHVLHPVGIGLMLILATTLGAGFAWLILR